jgi:hypothetical protein
MIKILQTMFFPLSLLYIGYEKLVNLFLVCMDLGFRELIHLPVRLSAVQQDRSWYRDAIDWTCFWMVPFLILLIVATSVKSVFVVILCTLFMYAIVTAWFSIVFVCSIIFLMPHMFAVTISLGTMRLSEHTMQRIWENMMYGVTYQDTNVEWRFACLERRFGVLGE